MRISFVLPAAVLLLSAAAVSRTARVPAPLAVDTAAANRGLDSLRDRYIAAQTAGDATALAALFSETGGMDLFGLPRLRGRAALEAAFKADLAARKYTLSEIHAVNRSIRNDSAASEIGTYHDMHDAKGKKDHEWGRYVGGFDRGPDGRWTISYLMAFPDSIKPAK